MPPSIYILNSQFILLFPSVNHYRNVALSRGTWRAKTGAMCQSATVEGATSQHTRFMVMESQRKLNSFLSLSRSVHLPSTFFLFSYLSLGNFFFRCFCLLRPLAFVCIAMALSVTLPVCRLTFLRCFFLFQKYFHFHSISFSLFFAHSVFDGTSSELPFLISPLSFLMLSTSFTTFQFHPSLVLSVFWQEKFVFSC